MIELNSSVHEHPMGLLAEMREMRDALVEAADAVGVSVAGGGAHPFMRWQERSISDTPRFQYLAEMYGYLARQFTVFGQHIHLGVKSGDDAIRLVRRLSPYVPHFIALSASSPYCEGVDTLFSCSRLNAVNSFPLAGHMPPEVKDWYQFEAHLSQLRAYGLAESIKDLYWDIRPKPEFGTVEIRVCDTPLTVERACQIAALAQALAVLLMREPEPSDKAWLSYRSNHFQACRFGLQGSYVTPDGQRMRLIDPRAVPAPDSGGRRAGHRRHDRGPARRRHAQRQRFALAAQPVPPPARPAAGGGGHVHGLARLEREPAPAEPAAVLRRRIRATSEPMAALPGAEPGVIVPDRLH